MFTILDHSIIHEGSVFPSCVYHYGYRGIIDQPFIGSIFLHFSHKGVADPSCAQYSCYFAIPSRLSHGHVIIVVMLDIVEEGAWTMVCTLLLFLLC